tara:strand:- start:10606 stop:10854 length:249 start_codon:yes stop_codon:yes gene_type:complete
VDHSVALQVLRVTKDADKKLEIFLVLILATLHRKDMRLTNLAARWTHRVDVMMKPGMEIPYAIFSSVPPALAKDGLATYWPQ